MQHLLLLNCHKLKVNQVYYLVTGVVMLVGVLGTLEQFARVAEVDAEQAL